MAVRRKRTRVDRSGAVKLKRAAALHHNAKLLTLGGPRVVSQHEARGERVKNVLRRQQGRQKTIERGLFDRVIERGLDPGGWFVRAKGMPRGARRK